MAISELWPNFGSQSGGSYPNEESGKENQKTCDNATGQNGITFAATHNVRIIVPNGGGTNSFVNSGGSGAGCSGRKRISRARGSERSYARTIEMS